MKLIRQLEVIGYKIYLKGDKLGYKYVNRDRLDPDVTAPLLEELKQRKDEVIRHLKLKEEKKPYNHEEFMASLEGFITEETRKLFFCEGRKK